MSQMMPHDLNPAEPEGKTRCEVSIEPRLGRSLLERALKVLYVSLDAAQKRWIGITADVNNLSHLRAKLAKAIGNTDIPACTKAKIQDELRLRWQTVKDRTVLSVNEAAVLTNALLACDFRQTIESWLKGFNEGVPSRYDEALDARYVESHRGGGHLHRLFDGNHTVLGAWQAITDALPDDTLRERLFGCLTALAKDLSSPVGLPLFTWDPKSYDAVADALSVNLGVSREWFADLLHVNAAEAMGTTIGTIAVALNWDKRETLQFARLAATFVITGLESANPALAILTLVAFARAYHDCREAKDYSLLIEGIAKGGIGTGVFLASSGLIGGPAWIGALTGLCIGMAVNRSLNTMKLTDIAAFVDVSLRKAIRGSNEDTAPATV